LVTSCSWRTKAVKCFARKGQQIRDLQIATATRSKALDPWPRKLSKGRLRGFAEALGGLSAGNNLIPVAISVKDDGVNVDLEPKTICKNEVGFTKKAFWYATLNSLIISTLVDRLTFDGTDKPGELLALTFVVCLSLTFFAPTSAMLWCPN
jgi:hypothetical protein